MMYVRKLLMYKVLHKWLWILLMCYVLSLVLWLSIIFEWLSHPQNLWNKYVSAIEEWNKYTLLEHFFNGKNILLVAIWENMGWEYESMNLQIVLFNWIVWWVKAMMGGKVSNIVWALNIWSGGLTFLVNVGEL